MKKTPIQKLIEWSQNDLEIFIEDTDEAIRIFKAIEEKATQLLEEEKQMVVDAYDRSKTSVISSNAYIAFKTGEQYYNEKYEEK